MSAGRAPSTSVRSAGSGRLRRNHDFVRLLTGQGVSVLGIAVTDLALPTVAVLELHAGPAAVALVTACGRLPFPVLALPVGAMVDRMSRRRAMIAADAGRCLVIGLVPLLAALGALTLWSLAVISLAAGALGVVFDVAYMAYVPALVGSPSIGSATATLQIVELSANVAGPGVAGLLIQAVGAARTMAANAGSYVVSVVMLLMIRRPEPPPEPRVAGRRLRHDIREGLSHVLRHPLLGPTLLWMTAYVLFMHSIDAVQVVFAYRDLHLTPGQFGLVLTMAGAGAVAGVALARPLGRAVGFGRAMALASVAAGILLALVPLARTVPALPFLAVLLLAQAMCGAVGNVQQVILRQVLTPERLRARMTSVFRAAYWGAWPVGGLLGGVAAAAVGTAPVLTGAGVLGAVCGIGLLLSPAGRLRHLPGG